MQGPLGTWSWKHVPVGVSTSESKVTVVLTHPLHVGGWHPPAHVWMNSTSLQLLGPVSWAGSQGDASHITMYDGPGPNTPPVVERAMGPVSSSMLQLMNKPVVVQPEGCAATGETPPRVPRITISTDTIANWVLGPFANPSHGCARYITAKKLKSSQMTYSFMPKLFHHYARFRMEYSNWGCDCSHFSAV